MGKKLTNGVTVGLWRDTTKNDRIRPIPYGEVVEIVSGPHTTEEAPLYCVQTVRGERGFMHITTLELGHAHGPVVPVPTEASAATSGAFNNLPSAIPAPVVDAVVEYDQTHAINALQSAFNALEAKNDELRAMYDPLKRANATLEKTNQELQAALNKLGGEYAELQARNVANGEEYRKVKELLAETEGLAVARLEELDADTLEKNRLRAERDELRCQHDLMARMAAGYSARLAALESKLTPDFIEWKAQEERAMTEQANAAKPGNVVLTPANGGEVIVNGNIRVEGRVAQAMHPIVKTLTADAEAAAWRLAGSQFVKTTRAPLVGLLTRHLAPDGDDALRARIAAFLETELGTSLLAVVLSLGLSAMPANGSQVPEKLARELRVRSMAGTADVVADLLMEPLRQVMATYLKDVAPMLPAAPATLGEGAGIRSEVVEGAEAVVEGRVKLVGGQSR